MKKNFIIGLGERSEMDKKLLERAANLDVSFTRTTDEAWDIFKSRVEKKSAEKKRSLTTVYLSIAASVVILLAIWLVWPRNTAVNVIADKGTQKEFALPDSSVVAVNADTKITYNKKDFEEDRDLQMNGEAFFEVKKGKSFRVRTPYGEIKVLGTTFNVLARKNIFKVSCFTGKVSVSTGDQSVILTPGESCIAENNKLKKFDDSNISNVSKWRDGEFYFDNTSLKIVLEEIERQFNVKFVSENIDERFFTGSFSNDKLTDALDIVCIPMGLTYEIDSDNKILIRPKVR